MNPKFYTVVILSVFIVIAGFIFDFGHELIWLQHTTPNDFLVLMLRLLFLSLVVERVVEFYILIYRSKGRKDIESQIANEELNTTQNLPELNHSLIEYKATTRINASILGFAIGVCMAIVGIRVFTGMFDFEDASGAQIVMFDIFETLMMGSIMAGGSKGINTIISAVEKFVKQKPTETKSKAGT